ncbi:Hypothetical predicted protein [Pelobates cultripes]|uniref:Uncharacterized protein n=1 Tax=Pelobates cultripes TaxID=61616 RepID=A0AAD1SV17_PELCU|nr:Hypothetical predicted protein [Pelobates cultripes]
MVAQLRHALDRIQSQSRYSDLALKSFLAQSYSLPVLLHKPHNLHSDDILSNPLLAVKAWKMARASMGASPLCSIHLPLLRKPEFQDGSNTFPFTMWSGQGL